MAMALGAASQDILNLYPKVTPLNFSVANEREFDSLVALCDSAIWSFEYCGDAAAGYWDTEDGSCSWYCNGGPTAVSASSFLLPQGSNTYEPKNAHNWSYKSAWAEGVPGYGIGEYLTYVFPAPKPRVGTIKVANGYVKSITDWENNSRVKELKVYVNDKPYAILHLQDSRSLQAFTVEPIGNHPDTWDAVANNPDWTMKFEIMAVYPGKKYKDTVISDLFFDGPDAHSQSEDWRWRENEK